MNRPASREPSPGALRSRRYLERRAQGLQRVQRPWDGLTAAKASTAAREAFKAVTWAYRDAGADRASELRQQLARAFASLLERELGQRDAAQWVDELARDMPSTWTAQYPQFGVSSEEVS